MMRLSADQLTASVGEDDRRIARVEQTGANVGQDRQRFTEESRAQQEIANAQLRRFIQEANTEGVNGLAQAQTKFDRKSHERIDERYKREKALRLEAFKEMRERRFRLNQLYEEVRRSTLRSPIPLEESRQEEIR